MRGSVNNDIIDGARSTGGITADGAAGNDVLFGGSGNDTLLGGIGDDSLYGGAGADSLSGGDGNDVIYGFAPAGGPVTVVNGDFANGATGWAGIDGTITRVEEGSLSFNAEDQPAGGTISQTIQTQTGAKYTLSLDAFENNTGIANHTLLVEVVDANGVVIASQSVLVLNDTTQQVSVPFTATTNAVTLRHSNTAATETINTDLKIDNITVTSQPDPDDNASDTLDGGAGTDLIFGGGGDDLIFGGANVDTLHGGAGNDEIHGDDGGDFIYGGDGDDVVFGGGGRDLIYGGAGQDDISGGAGNDTIYGDAGNDNLHGNSGDDLIYGGDGDDTIQGGDSQDVLHGDAGNDLLVGGAGNDTLFGGAGDDTLRGGSEDDLITTGDGADTVVMDIGGGTDTITDFNTARVDGRAIDQLDVSLLINPSGEPVTWRDVTVTDTVGDGSGDAILTFTGGERVILQGVRPDQVDGKQDLNAIGIPCFAAGMPILTPSGPRLVETLAIGDLVLTQDGPVPVIWAGARTGPRRSGRRSRPLPGLFCGRNDRQ